MPYAALGFLDDDECLMTPRGGADRDVVFLHADDGAYAAHAGSLSPDLKSFSADATGAFYASLVEVDAAFEADVAFEDGALSLSLLAPGPHFTFALGNAPQLGYHATRGCFTVEGAPSCAAVAAAADAAAPCEAAVAIDDDDDRVLELESTVAELRGELAAFRSDWAAAAEDAPAVPPAVDQELRDEVSALRRDVDGFERDWRESEEEPAAHDEVLRGEVAALRSDVDGLRGDRRDAPAPALAAPARCGGGGDDDGGDEPGALNVILGVAVLALAVLVVLLAVRVGLLEAAAAKHRDLQFRKTEAPVESKEEPPYGAPPTPDKVAPKAPARRPTVIHDEKDISAQSAHEAPRDYYVVAIAGDEPPPTKADYVI